MKKRRSKSLGLPAQLHRERGREDAVLLRNAVDQTSYDLEHGDCASALEYLGAAAYHTGRLHAERESTKGPFIVKNSPFFVPGRGSAHRVIDSLKAKFVARCVRPAQHGDGTPEWYSRVHTVQRKKGW